MQKINVIGIDLAKNVMQVCKIDQNGELHSNKAMSPNKLKELLAKSIPSIVAMEGCGACHYVSDHSTKNHLTFCKSDINKSSANLVFQTRGVSSSTFDAGCTLTRCSTSTK